ncbi:MAG: hypothetical protein D6B28_05220 [Gammaproteobacteria bacterium]|nr:MAG: hypothetical protein D6B28_05220 [Gammaproteobacteria bacterium]
MKLARIIALASLVLVGGTATAAQWQVVDQAGMEVRIYKPDSEPLINDKRALMISMHGCAVNMNGAKWMQEKANWQPTADEYGMVVALPAAPNGGAYGWNCWDWKPTDHTRDNYFNSYILELVDNLIADQQLNIDPDQVYVSGLSSGAGQALILGCLAPDVFAGMGLSAAPPIGNGSINNVDEDLIASTCIGFAGDSADYFDTQVASIIIGSEDRTVPPATQKAIAFAMADVYQAKESNGSKIFPEEWSQSWVRGEYERVVFTEIPGMGHAWAAGGGPGDDWAIATGISYPAKLTQFLFENNQRVDAEACKNITLDELDYNPDTKVITASGTATKGCENAIVNINVAGATDSKTPANDEYSFTIRNVTCPDEISVTLVNASHETFTVTDMYTGSCGETKVPPVVESFNAITSKDTVYLTGLASDADGTVVGATIAIDETDYDVDVDDNGAFALTVDGIAAGEYTALVTVIDDDALTDDAMTEFTISIEELLPPTVRLKPVEVDGQTAVISGTASDADGEVLDVTLNINGNEYPVVINAGEFTITLTDLDAGSYHAVATATDNDQQQGSDTIDFEVEEIEKLPPSVSVDTNVDGTSVTIFGTASDVDGDIVEVVVSVNGTDYVVANGNYSKTITDLAAGSYDVLVTATDSNDLTATATTSFTIEKEEGEEENIWTYWLKWLKNFWKF